MNPIALNGPIVTIRRFPDKPVTMQKLIGLETKSGRDYYAQKLSEQMQSLTQEETAAVLSILETTIQQVKKLRNETT